MKKHDKALRDQIAVRLEVSPTTILRWEREYPELTHIIKLGIETERANGQVPSYRKESTQDLFDHLYWELTKIISHDDLIRLISVYTGLHKTAIVHRLGRAYEVGLEQNKQELIEAMKAIKEKITEKI